MSKIKKIFFDIIESLIRNISGGIGIFIRKVYYKTRFKNFGNNIRIEEGVIFQGLENISIGDNSWIGAYSIITAYPSNTISKNTHIVKKENMSFDAKIGEINIGKFVHIGNNNIIQGFGGVVIEDFCVTSSGVKLYSQSNLPYWPNNLNIKTVSNSRAKDRVVPVISHPIVLKEGSWLAINVLCFGGTVGNYTFVKSNSLILGDLKSNSIYSGNPIKFLKHRFNEA